MEPISWCTACWRGYALIFAVENRNLILAQLDVSLTDPSIRRNGESGIVPAPTLQGHEAVCTTDEEFGLLEYSYRDLDLRVAFTGGLLLARDFIDELYVHMGSQPAWKFASVLELIFEDGHLSSETDQSEKMAGFRQDMETAGVRRAPAYLSITTLRWSVVPPASRRHR